MSIQKIIEEYSDEYCHILEAAYGKGMMSEGGTEAIETMFSGIAMQNKKVLDIGFGLGGVAFYLAEKYQTHVTGLEINPWMVTETAKRTPTAIQHLTHFQLYNDVSCLDFADNSFDLVYSKGVLTHVEDKQDLFAEIHRILRPNGEVIIVDWLSPTAGLWGPRIQQLCEVENLTLFAESEENYIKLLEHAGFLDIQMKSENSAYSRYNREIANRAQEKQNKSYFCEKFDEKIWQEIVEGYQLIAEAMENNELLVRWFRAKK